MAVKGTKEGTSGADVLNAIRSSIIAGGDLEYGNRIPEATQENLTDIGRALFEYEAGMNEFLDTLINRIGLVIIKGRMYKNKLAFFKRGFLNFGDAIEEIFVDIAKAHEYKPEPPKNNLGDVYEVFKPKVVSAFHKINRQDQYPITINESLLKRAFTSYAQFDSFIARIFDSVYNADEYDEYILFKRLLGAMASNTYKVHVDMPTALDKSTSENFSIAMRAWGLNLTYLSRNYNQAGVANHTPLEEQILILRSDIVPILDVTVLANSFNMNLATPISGRIVVVDDFGNQDANIVAMIVDSEFSMIYDTKFDTTSEYNSRHLYWNYFLNHWQIISSSPFANVIAFTTGNVVSSVDAISIAPTKADVIKGTEQTFEARIEYTGNPNLGVSYAVTGGTSALTSINNAGVLTVGNDETADTLTVTVTSTADTSKTASATVTVKDNIVA